MFGRCFETWPSDVAARVLVALAAFATLFHPNDALVWGTGAVTLAALVWGIARHNRIAPPKDAPAGAQSAPAPAEDLARMVAEARRDIG